jgi:hypothetical protein
VPLPRSALIRHHFRVASLGSRVPWGLVSWALTPAHAAWFSRAERFGNRKDARRFDQSVLGSAVAELIVLEGVVALGTVGALWLLHSLTKVDPTQPLIMIPAMAPTAAVVLASFGMCVLMVPAALWRKRNGWTTPYFTHLARSRDARTRLDWAAVILALPTSALTYLTF